MRVWLLKVGEPLPVGGQGRPRLLRTGLIAQYLGEAGHEVVWWTGTYDHLRKQHVVAGEARLAILPNVDVQFLRARGYRKNLSLARLLNHRALARRFLMHAAKEQPPDIVVSAYPTIEFCDAATRFGQHRKIPVVVDLRDMWPDVFVAHLPQWLGGLGRLALRPMFKQARQALGRASALTGITQEFLEWGRRRSGRNPTHLDRVVPLAFPATAPCHAEIAAAEAFWECQGVSGKRTPFTMCFVGSLGLQLDLSPIIDASRRLEELGVAHRLVICGEGERLHTYRNQAESSRSVLFPGWIDGVQLYVLLRRSHVGLDPMPARFDFLATINNKAVEYLSAGLPIISCPPEGTLYRLLQERGCGESFGLGDSARLAMTLAALAGDTARLGEMSRNALRLYESSFCAEQVYGEFAQYLAEVVRASRSGNGGVRV